MVWYPGTPEYIPYLVSTFRVPGYLIWLYPSAPRVYGLVSYNLRGLYSGVRGYLNWLSPNAPRVYVVPGSPRVYTLFGSYSYDTRVPNLVVPECPQGIRFGIVYPTWFNLWGTWVPKLVVPECPQSIWFGARVPQSVFSTWFILLGHPGTYPG